MKKKKLTNRKALVKYITAKKSGLEYLNMLSLYGSRINFESIMEEMDAIERLLQYIDKLLGKTPNLKRYLKLKSKGLTDGETFEKVNGIDKEELEEETFYVIEHIKHYEEKDNE